jgi:hypothetical protein
MLEPADLRIQANGEHGGDEDQHEDVPNRPRGREEGEDGDDREGRAGPVAHPGVAVLGHLWPPPLRTLSVRRPRILDRSMQRGWGGGVAW